MKIQINSNNEIVAYVDVGGLNNGIEINDFPPDFTKTFKPKKYKYENEQVLLNENYSEVDIQPTPPPSINMPGTDEELRIMFADMQVQLVQANMMVAQLSKQNARISQETVKLNQEIENLKGENKDEDVIPEV